MLTYFFQPLSGISALTIYLRDAEQVDHPVWEMKNVHLDFWEIGQVQMDFADSKYQVRMCLK